ARHRTRAKLRAEQQPDQLHRHKASGGPLLRRPGTELRARGRAEELQRGRHARARQGHHPCLLGRRVGGGRQRIRPGRL
ncbi:MAG: hypothetical protein AVDCRST_MAG78-1323, partial [uncultured Rubrobacteraceae bacterium]